MTDYFAVEGEREFAVRRNGMTIKDVAREAGCSTAVVSTVVNRAHGNVVVSDETRQRVITAAARLGYRPHFASRSLVRQRAQTIGVFIPCGGASIGYPYEAAILRGIEGACRAREYDLLAINLGGEHAPDLCAHKFTEQRIDGLLLLHVAHDASWVAPLAAAHRNIAAVNYYGPVRAIDTITFDDQAATRLAVANVLSLGHRTIGYIGRLSPFPGPGELLRRVGFETAIHESGLIMDPGWMIDESDPSCNQRVHAAQPPEAADLALECILALPPHRRPTAWVTHNDMVAIPLLQRLQGAGIRVPTDVSVIGIDDHEFCRYTTPALSSIRQPLEAMGARAADLVVGRAEAENLDSPTVHELFEPEFITRGSTAAPSVLVRSL